MWWTIVLLICSNIFMTFAWYGHLLNEKTRTSALWLAILASWGIAFVEYCFQVPANRIGSASGLTTYHLKTIQEVITLSVFIVFAWAVMGEALRWNHLVGFVLICAGAAFVFAPWAERMPPRGEATPSIQAAPNPVEGEAR